MKINVGNEKVEYNTCKELYKVLKTNSTTENYVNDLLKNRKATCDELVGAHIGSIDMTSCVAAVYFPRNVTWSHVFVQHHDGRKLDSLVSLFNEYKNGDQIDVLLLGGIRKKDPKGEAKSDYDLVHQLTRANFKSLVDFWQELPQQINLIGWCIGEETSKAELVSEFLVTPKGIVSLYNTETLIKYLDIPNMPRRMARSMASGNYEVVYDGLKQPDRMKFKSETRISVLAPVAAEIDQSSDSVILQSHSTTPLVEPFYFCQNMRDLAKFILAQNPKAPLPDLEVRIEPHSPVLVLQGESGRSPIV